MTDPIRVLCHDQRNLITGTLREVNDQGCELWSRQGGEAFARKTDVLLNLYNEQTGESMNVEARLTAVKREPKDETWVYKVRWQGKPSLIVA